MSRLRIESSGHGDSTKLTVDGKELLARSADVHLEACETVKASVVVDAVNLDVATEDYTLKHPRIRGSFEEANRAMKELTIALNTLRGRTPHPRIELNWFVGGIVIPLVFGLLFSLVVVR